MKKIIIISIAAVICSVVLGGSLYAIQINKQSSIERQARWELEQKEKELNLEKEKNEAENLRKNDEEIFTNNLKCQDLLKDLKDRWNNVTGIYYSSLQNTCIVKYRDVDTGKDEEAPVEDMQDT